MDRINTSYKASSAGATPGAAEGPNLSQLQSDIQTALAEIAEFKAQNAELLPEEKWRELEYIETMLKAESAAIAGYGVNGGEGPNGPDGERGGWRPGELSPEWNGIEPQNMNPDEGHRAVIEGDEARYGEYQSTVEIVNSGDPRRPTMVGFQMTDEMMELYVESYGRDLIFTVVLDTNGDGEEDGRKSWVLRDGVVRPEPIIISALGLSHGVIIDCSRAFRVSDGNFPGYPAGMRSGFYIHGTEHKDIINGSQAADGIVAYFGDDIVDGGAGADTIYGDEYYQRPGQFDPEGGNDDLRGGADRDIIFGGGGVDRTYSSDNGESITEHEGLPEDDVLTEPPPLNWFDSPDGTWQAEIVDGEVVVSNPSGRGGDMTIMMPDGYEMAYADTGPDGSLIITFVGVNDDGSTSTFKMRIEGFFDETTAGLTRINFIGSGANEIIDFSRIELKNQVINIKSGGGADLILNARYQLLSQGVDIDNLTDDRRSQRTSQGQLQGYTETMLDGYGLSGEYSAEEYAENGGYNATANGDGVITITEQFAGEVDQNGKKKAPVIMINAPYEEGYKTAYVADGGDGFIYVVLVKENEDGRANTIVIKIDADLLRENANDPINYGKLLIGYITESGEGESRQEKWNQMASPSHISIDEQDYTVDGEGGTDLVFTQKGARVVHDDDDAPVVEREINPEELGTPIGGDEEA